MKNIKLLLKNIYFWVSLLTVIAVNGIVYMEYIFIPQPVLWFVTTISGLVFLFTIINKFSLLKRVFGEMSYNWPDWFNKLVYRFKNSPNSDSIWKRIWRRKKILFGGLGTILIISSIVFYISTRERPPIVEVSVDSPDKTVMSYDKEKLSREVDSLRLKFDSSAAPLKDIGKVITKGVKISPEIDGEWKWVNDSLLSFQPKDDWKIGETYSVDIEEELISSKYILDEKSFEFETTPFSCEMGSAEFYENPNDPSERKVIFEFRTNYPVDTKDFIQYFKARQVNYEKGGSEISTDLKLSAHANEDRDKIYIHAEKITIPDSEGEVELAFVGELQSIVGGNSFKKRLKNSNRVPGAYDYFHVESSSVNIIKNEKNIPEQVLMVKFSTGVPPEKLSSFVELYQLPERDSKTNYINWEDRLGSLNRNSLKKYKKIELVKMDSLDSYPKTHFFKIKSTPDTPHFIQVKKGLESGSKFTLTAEYKDIVRAGSYPTEVSVVSEGAILNLKGDKKISIYSLNVKELEVRIGQLLGEQVQHLLTQTTGDLSDISFSNKYYFNQANITAPHKLKLKVRNPSHKKPSFTTIDFSSYLSRYYAGKRSKGLFFVEIKDRKSNKSDKRVILITDLGVIQKVNSSQVRSIFVQSLQSGGPVSGAVVAAVSPSGVPLFTKVTGSSGRVDFPKFDKVPVRGFVIKKKNDMTYIKLNDYYRRVDYSRFDIGGEYNDSNKNRLKAFLFSDRGIYRPGEDVHIGHIVKGVKWSRSLKGLPVKIRVESSDGNIIRDKILSLSGDGLGEFNFSLLSSAPTGNYEVSLYSFRENNIKKYSSLIGSVTIKVKEFRPDKLKVAVNLSTKSIDGWVSPEELSAKVNVKNLFGIPAIGNEVKGKMVLEPINLSFKKFPDFKFELFDEGIERFVEELSVKTTDQNGDVTFELPLDKFDKKIFRVRFYAQGFEKGSGNSVVSSDSTLVSSNENLIGYKALNSLKYIEKGDIRDVELVGIDREVKLVKVDSLTISLKEKKYINVLTKRSNGTFGYDYVEKEQLLWKKPYQLLNLVTSYRLDTKKGGDYTLIIRNSSDKKLLELNYIVVGERDLARSMQRNSELEVKLSKSDYKNGEMIEMEIKAPYEGAGLITIEKDKIYSHKWFSLTSKTGMVKIQVPANIVGNGYVNIMLARNMYSDEIYTQPFSYGAYPFSINRDSKKVKINFEVPEVVKPGDKLVVNYSTNTPSNIILFAVDKGILQFGGYKLPRPLPFFLKKKSLGVRTFQTFDLILPEFSILSSHLAPGGDMFGGKGMRLNPFKRKKKKPVAFWSGVVKSVQKKNSWNFTVPDYFNGSLDIMAVAVSRDSLGSLKDSSFVRAELILNADVPTFLAPGDLVKIPFLVLNNLPEKARDAPVTLSVKIDDKLTTKDKLKQKIKIPHNHEEGTTLSFTANDLLGSGNLAFSATAKGYNYSLKESFSLRPPRTYHTDMEMGGIRDGKKSIEIERTIYDSFAKRELWISSSPIVVVKGILKYLKSNTYGCSEQLVSKTFPHVLLAKSKLYQSYSRRPHEYVEKIIQILRTRIADDGSFYKYGNMSDGSDSINLYITHFLIETKERGFYVPADLLKRTLKYLKNSVDDFTNLKNRAYGVYLLTRAEVVTTPYLQKLVNSFYELKKSSSENRDLNLINMYLASTYKLLQNGSAASGYLDKVKFFPKESYFNYPYGSSSTNNSILLYLVSRHFKERASEIPADQLMAMTNSLRVHMNTMSSAYALLAIGEFEEAVRPKLKGSVSITKELKDGKKREEVLKIENTIEKVIFSKEIKKITVNNSSDTPVYYNFIHGGFDRAGNKFNSLGMEIFKEIVDKEGKQVKSVSQGDELTVNITFRATVNRDFSESVITDLLPAGFSFIPDNVMGTTFSDFREDRVLIYTGVTKDSQKVSYNIKATHAGIFKLPSALVEDMYQINYRARSEEGSVEVVKMVK